MQLVVQYMTKVAIKLPSAGDSVQQRSTPAVIVRCCSRWCTGHILGEPAYRRHCRINKTNAYSALVHVHACTQDSARVMYTDF